MTVKEIVTSPDIRPMRARLSQDVSETPDTVREQRRNVQCIIVFSVWMKRMNDDRC